MRASRVTFAASSCSGDGVQAYLTSGLAATNLVLANDLEGIFMALAIFSEERRKWWTLAAVSFGLFMIMLDNTVVNVALPSIQDDLGADLSELQWIVTGYALSFAALMLIGGKLADAYGRRLIFVVGIVVFTRASLWCGLADSRQHADRGARRPGRPARR